MRTKLTVLVAVISTMALMLPATATPTTQEYIVVLHQPDRPVADTAADIARTAGGEVGFVYENALHGFTITIPEQAAAGLARNPNVAFIEPVVEVSAADLQPIPTHIDRIDGDLNPVSSPMDVDIAIIDTGIYIGTNANGSSRGHLDLNLRYVTDCTGAILYPMFGSCSGGGNFQDDNGHGTHVAGIAAARNNEIGSLGAAPGATLWSVKVLNADGTGTSGMLLAGIDFVAANADQIEVANMSLTFAGSSAAIDQAISTATDNGIVFVAAAGNSSALASGYSPGNSPDALTVSAVADFDGLPGGQGTQTCRTDVDDTLADFSNFGPTVDIAAPGVCIYSTHLNDGYATFSGTSMASPLVAGAIARYIAETGHPTDSRSDVEAIKSAIMGSAVPQASACGFADVDNDPEPMLFVNGGAFGGNGDCGQGGPLPDTPPTASFSSSCVDLDCSFTDTSFDDGEIVEWSWDFGDGATSTEQNPGHSYATAGTYPVTLRVTDDLGAVSETTSDVTVTDPAVDTPPTASFDSSCVALDCSFTDTSSDDGDVVGWSWDFGDGASSSQQNPGHSYATDGTYTVTLTVTDDLGASSQTSSDVTVTTPVANLVTGEAAPFSMVDSRTAQVSLLVFDETLSLVGGATVEGEWTYLDRRGRSKTTLSSTTSSGAFIDGLDPAGNAVISKRFPTNSTVTQFCITSITAPGYDYQPSSDPCVPIAATASHEMPIVFREGLTI